jgi:DNA-binding XRE family transcriptional regulator
MSGESTVAEVPKNRVRRLREEKLMTQKELAKRAGVALRTVHSVEKGAHCLMYTKRKIVLALGLSFEQREEVFPRDSSF